MYTRLQARLWLAALALTACSHAPRPNSLKRFTEEGTETLAEITSSTGGQWKLLTRETGALTALFIYDSSSHIVIAAGAVPRPSGPAHATIFADPGQKDAVLALLDRKYLASLSGRTTAFDGWLNKIAPFTDEKADRLDVKPGALGTGMVTTDGRIIVRQQTLPIACGTTGAPDCVNAVCGFINCIFRGTGPCQGEAFKAQEACQSGSAP